METRLNCELSPLFQLVFLSSFAVLVVVQIIVTFYHPTGPRLKDFNHRVTKLIVCPIHLRNSMAMFTLYRIVKRSIAESVPDRASVHTRNAVFEAVSVPE